MGAFKDIFGIFQFNNFLKKNGILNFEGVGFWAQYYKVILIPVPRLTISDMRRLVCFCGWRLACDARKGNDFTPGIMFMLSGPAIPTKFITKTELLFASAVERQWDCLKIGPRRSENHIGDG